MTKSNKKSFAVRLCLADREEIILDFHKRHLTEHLWPRTLDEFKQLTEEQCLYEVIDMTGGRDELVGICYIKYGEEPDSNFERNEFGGIFIVPAFQGHGLASALGILAISQHYVFDPPLGRTVAHVHETNLQPRGLLTNQLGFIKVGQEIPPAEIAPPSMAKNNKGEVVSDLFEFQLGKLNDFAQWLEDFDGTVVGKDQKQSSLHLDLSIAMDRINTIKALREIAQRK